MDASLILTYILIFFSLIIGPMLVVVLYKIIRILSEVEEVVLYIEHIRKIFETWEQIPFALLKKLSDFWTK